MVFPQAAQELKPAASFSFALQPGVNLPYRQHARHADDGNDCAWVETASPRDKGKTGTERHAHAHEPPSDLTPTNYTGEGQS